MTTGKTIALTRETFVGKVMSLLSNMLSRLVIWRRKWQPTLVFLPGEFHGQRSLLGYSQRGHRESDPTELLNNNKVGHSFSSMEQAPFNFMAAVILEPKEIKSDTVSTVSPSVCHEVMGLDAMILVF